MLGVGVVLPSCQRLLTQTKTKKNDSGAKGARVAVSTRTERAGADVC
jgi:hypothetical protein